MSITMKLFSGLVEYLPPEAVGNALQVSISLESPIPTPHILIDKYRLPRKEAQVVMVNGKFVPPEKRDIPLQDGDVMSVWPSIQGG